MNFLGDNNMVWILLMLVIFDGGDDCGGGCGCDSIIWLLLLSKFCGGGARGGRAFGLGGGCGCGCERREEPVGCGCGCR